MAAPVGAVRAEISASAVKFYSEMEKVRQSASKTGSSFGNMGKSLQGLGKSREAFSAVVGGLSGVGGKAGIAASKLVEFVAVGLNPVVLGITAVTTGLALWINRGRELEKINVDLQRSQEKYGNSLAVTNARLRDMREGTKTADTVALQRSLALARQAEADALAELKSGFGDQSTRFGDLREGFARAYGTRQETLEATFQEARSARIKLEDDMAFEAAQLKDLTNKTKEALQVHKKQDFEAGVRSRIDAQDKAAADRDAAAHREVISRLQEQLRIESEITAKVQLQAVAREKMISALEVQGFRDRKIGAADARDAERLRLNYELRDAKDQALEAGGERSDLIRIEREFFERRAAMEERFRREDAAAAAADLKKREEGATKSVSYVTSLVSELEVTAKEGIAGGLADAFVSAGLGAEKLGDAVKKVAVSVISDLTRMTLKAYILNSVLSASWSGGGGGGGGGAGAGSSASAGALTLAPAKAPALQVNVTNYSGADVSARETRGPGGQRQLDILVGQAMARDFAQGGPGSRAAQGAFGLRRAPRSG